MGIRQKIIFKRFDKSPYPVRGRDSRSAARGARREVRDPAVRREPARPERQTQHPRGRPLEDDEPRVRARAFAGLGLCDAAIGDEASADANYERARALEIADGTSKTRRWARSLLAASRAAIQFDR